MRGVRVPGYLYGGFNILVSGILGDMNEFEVVFVWLS